MSAISSKAHLGMVTVLHDSQKSQKVQGCLLLSWPDLYLVHAPWLVSASSATLITSTALGSEGPTQSGQFQGLPGASESFAS